MFSPETVGRGWAEQQWEGPCRWVGRTPKVKEVRDMDGAYVRISCSGVQHGDHP